MRNLSKGLMALSLLLSATLLGLSACEVPDNPTGMPSATIPSESPDTNPPCYQTLQCIIENTGDNALRKETQVVINQLFQLDEPEYTTTCQAKAEELVARVPQCTP